MTGNATVDIQTLQTPKSLVYQGVPKPGPKQQGTVTRDYTLNRYGLRADLGDPLLLSDSIHAVAPDDIPILAMPLKTPGQPAVSVSTEWTDVSPGATAKAWSRVCLLYPENEVVEFAAREGIIRYIPAVRDLVYNCFSRVSRVEFEIESDPDTGEKWISVNARVSGSPERIVVEYNEFTQRSLVELPEQVMESIRLFYYAD